MKRMLFDFTASVLIALASTFASAQTTPAQMPSPAAGQGGQGGQGGMMNRNAGPPQVLDLTTAKKIAAAAEAAAAAQNQHIAICIMDVRGDMVFFERGDVINSIPVGSSQGKAHAVLVFGLPTKQLAASIKAGTPVTATLRAPMAGYGELDIRQGGLPIMRDGKMIGAIGVGGSSSESDEDFAQAGLNALAAK